MIRAASQTPPPARTGTEATRRSFNYFRANRGLFPSLAYAPGMAIRLAIAGSIAVLATMGCQRDADPSAPAPTGDTSPGRSQGSIAAPEKPRPTGDLAESQRRMAEALEAAKSTAASPPTTSIEHGTDTRPTIKVLTTGTEPRKQLRFRFAKGTKEHLVLTTNQSITNNGQSAGSIPTIKIMMDVEVIAVEPNGDAKYEFTFVGSEVIGRPGIPTMVVTATQRALDYLDGVRGTSFVDTRGFNRDFTVEIPPSLPSEIQAQLTDQLANMGQTSAPFPVDAVGVGARWEVQQTLNQHGVRMEQVATFELVELGTDSGKLVSVVAQSAEPQALPPPSPGVTARLMKLQGSGTGQVRYDLNGLVPTALTTIALELRMEASAQGQREVVELRIEQGAEVGIR